MLKTKHPIAHRLTLVAVLLLALALRLVDVERTPPPLNVDEAVNAYDAYALLKTGRDQWGRLWPITMRAFNDYRRPATIYSAIPFMALFGLTIFGIRAMAAFWGWLTVLFTYRLARDMFGKRTGLAAALMLALSPWHIHFSRLGVEVSGPMLCAIVAGLDFGWRWHTMQHARWLYASGITLTLALYTYTTAQAFVPLLLLVIGVLFWRELWAQRRVVLMVGLLMIMIAAPLAIAILRNPSSWNRLNAISVLSDPNARGWSTIQKWRAVLQQWRGHFTPAYLFLIGDAQPIHHPPGSGQLYWLDMLLIPMGLIALIALTRRDRRGALLLLAWLALGPIPAALTRQDMGSANAMRGIAGLPAWAILSGLGLAWVAELNAKKIRAGLVGLLLGVLAWNVTLVQTAYFTTYPHNHARDFEYGIREALAYVQTHADADTPIVLTNWISQPHIFAVFFTQYDPHNFQQTHAPYGDRLSTKLTAWGDRYQMGDVDQLYAALDHGWFITRPHMLPDVTPEWVITHPDGSEAFKVVKK